MRKLSRQQKAANTRKKQSKIIEGLKEAVVSENQVGPVYTPAPVLTLCGQLEDAIVLLETRISNAIAKINSLM